MTFDVPGSTQAFEAPDDWWTEARMEGFTPAADHSAILPRDGTLIIDALDVQPPLREGGAFWYRNRESVVKVLVSMRTGEELEPILVWSKEKKSSPRYQVRDGFHRFYLSIAAGFTKLPIIVNDFDLMEFFEQEANGTL